MLVTCETWSLRQSCFSIGPVASAPSTYRNLVFQSFDTLKRKLDISLPCWVFSQGEVSRDTDHIFSVLKASVAQSHLFQDMFALKTSLEWISRRLYWQHEACCPVKIYILAQGSKSVKISILQSGNDGNIMLTLHSISDGKHCPGSAIWPTNTQTPNYLLQHNPSG